MDCLNQSFTNVILFPYVLSKTFCNNNITSEISRVRFEKYRICRSYHYLVNHDDREIVLVFKPFNFFFCIGSAHRSIGTSCEGI